MKKDFEPPRLAFRWLDRFSGREDDYGAAGDCEEFYRALAAERGVRSARRACWGQVAAAFPGYAKNSFIWSGQMLRHYFKVAVRNLWKHKGYSFINIMGLAVGLMGAAFVLLWVQDEASFDRFHDRPESLFRVEQDLPSPRGLFHVAATPFPLGPALKGEVPEVADSARYLFLGERLLRRGESAFYEKRIRAVDASFFRLFAFRFVRGNPSTALDGIGSIVLTRSTAGKYFGAADPMGGAIILDNSRTLTVTGIIEDAPRNSSLTFDGLIPLDLGRALGRYGESWANNNPMTFVRLHAPGDAAAAAEKMTRLVRIRAEGGPGSAAAGRAALQGAPANARTVMLRPMADIRLKGYFGNSRSNPARAGLRAFSAIAFFVLLTACLNFMSLATARSGNRAKEIGLRKVVGARRNSLIGQFFGETLLAAGLAGALSLALALVFLPAFRALSGKAIASSGLADGSFFLGMLGVALLAGLLAGSYPALRLASFQPVKVLKGDRPDGARGVRFRRILVVFQFGLSIILLAGLGVVTRQVGYMKAKSVGYDKDQLIYLPLRADLGASYPVLRERLLGTPRVLGVTATHQEPTSINSNTWEVDWEGKGSDRGVIVGYASVDFEFTDTLGIPLAAGRGFSRSSAADRGHAFLVNEEMVKLMKLDPGAALGRRFTLSGSSGPIVGVLKSFHFQSVRSAIEPLAVFVDPAMFGFAVVRLRAGDIPSALADVRSAWRRVYPQYPFDYRFFDQDFEADYRADERTGTALKTFTLMSLFISSLGLLGLSSFMAERRTREIGVRKVFGASSRSIVLLLSWDFARWVLAANVFAWPIAYFLMGKWLQGFAYRSGFAWWLLPAAGAGALAIALVTVGVQAVRASRTNPAATLKYE